MEILVQEWPVENPVYPVNHVILKKTRTLFLQFQNKFVIVVQRTLGLLLFLYESFLFPTLSASHLMGVSNLLL